MKKLLWLMLVLDACSVFAQPGSREEDLLSEADHYFNEEQYNLASQYYQNLYLLSDQNAEVTYRLAESYRKIFNYTEAEVYYLKTTYQSQSSYPLALYYYALMLKLNGNYDESINRFSEFITLNKQNKTLQEFVEQAAVDLAGSEMAKTESLNPENNNNPPTKSMTINSVFNDFAPALKDSTAMVITSGRIESNRTSIDERYGEAFTDNFYFVRNSSLWQDKTRQLFAVNNTRFNDGTGCFNREGTAYYFTICGKDGPECKIYKSSFRNNKWTEPFPLNENINFKKFESKHPAISAGGDTILFSSNRPGGFGQFDIWISINAGNENWGPAMNLGGSVNTKLNEIAPACTQYPNIFFMSSDGHQNYGGLDLYMVKRLSNGTMAVYNLDFPFNSNKDDCFMVLGPRTIFFSSNRAGGKGGFDIYSFDIPSVLAFTSKLSLKKRDSRNDVKLNARVDRVTRMDLITARNDDKIGYENLTYEKKKIVDRMIARQSNQMNDSLGNYAGLSRQDYETLLKISEAQFETRKIMQQNARTFLSRVSSDNENKGLVDIEGTLGDSLTGLFLVNRQILLMDESGEILKSTTTNETGHFRFTYVKNSSHLYLKTTELFTEGKERPIATSLRISSAEMETTTKFENIYFDFNHYTLRPEAEQVLRELSEYLKQFPLLQVELYAYADDLGADDYNMKLTQKRGQSVLDYLTSLGVDQTALAVTARGKQKNPTSQVEIQRQFNRRVEFRLNGPAVRISQMAKTYILKQKSSWISVAATTGISLDVLKRLNGATSELLETYQPVRLPITAKIDDVNFFEVR